MSQHPIGMNMEAHRAFMERIFWHTVGVVDLRLEPCGEMGGANLFQEHIGTGTGIDWRGVPGILTARHNVLGAKASDLAFFLRPSDSIEWGAAPSKRKYSERISLPVDSIYESESESLDLAFIALKQEARTLARLQFCDLENRIEDPPLEKNVALLGHPVDQNQRLGLAPGQPMPSMVFASNPEVQVFTVVPAPTAALKGYDPAKHVLLAFDIAKDGRRAEGFSGTAIWHARDKNLVWSPDLLFGGVETHAYRNSQLLRVTRGSVVKSFLSELFPE